MQNKYLKHVRKCLNIVTKTITTKRLHTYSLILAKSLGGGVTPLPLLISSGRLRVYVTTGILASVYHIYSTGR